MSALDASLDVAAANDVRTSAGPAGAHETGGPASGGAAVRAAGWLSLAAAPTFAIMALLAGVSGGGPPDMLCAAARDASPLSGMVPMYLLMSAFHAAPWLKLISTRVFPG
jgi:hypothetical protein